MVADYRGEADLLTFITISLGSKGSSLPMAGRDSRIRAKKITFLF